MKRTVLPAPKRGVDTNSARDVQEQAAAWKARVDAGLSPKEEAQLQAWLNADPVHATALARFDFVWRTFDRPFQSGATDAMLQALEVRSKRRRQRLASSAATVLGLLVVASGWYFSSRERADSALEKAGRAITAKTTSARLLLPTRQELPDGSIAELKAGAEIALEFSAEVRRVVLRRGEVHFQVTKDSQRPFVVASHGVEARAVGTAFSVQLSAHVLEVLVTEGRVSVNQSVELSPPASPLATTGESPLSSLAVLDAGTRMVVDLFSPSSTRPQITAVLPAELDARLAWRAPRVEFTRTTLAEAVAVLNGYAAARRAAGQDCAQFLIKDPSLAEIRVSGLFRVDRTVAFIGVLKSGFGIEVEAQADGELVLHRAHPGGSSPVRLD
jgi:transmembrane sensor